MSSNKTDLRICDFHLWRRKFYQKSIITPAGADCTPRLPYCLHPVPRFVTFRCCDDSNHCKNFSESNYLFTLQADLKKVQDIVESPECEGDRHPGADHGVWEEGRDDEGEHHPQLLVKRHGSCQPTHLQYFKLESNLMDLHKNYENTNVAKNSISKRQRNDSSNDDHKEQSWTADNAAKKKNLSGSEYSEYQEGDRPICERLWTERQQQLHLRPVCHLRPLHGQGTSICPQAALR
jgi:hypothetical protein